MSRTSGDAAPRLIYLIAFFSGSAALVYEILWTRQLSLILGSTTASISTVVAAFMGGLALGSFLLGRVVDRARRHLWLYGLLELGIAASALAVTFSFPLVESLTVSFEAAVGGGAAWFALGRFLIVSLLLLVPTTLMGGTFPVLTRALVTDMSVLGGRVGRLYAANTFGAVAGCGAAGIFLLGSLGLRGTGWVAVTINLVLGASTLAIQRSLERRAAGAVTRGSQGDSRIKKAAAPKRDRGRHLASSRRDESAARAEWKWEPRRVAILAATLSGFFSLGYEIVWSRALSIVLGHSIYAFTFVLCTYLAGLAAGGWVAGRVLDAVRDTRGALALAVTACGGSAAATLAVIPILPFRDYVPGSLPIPYVLANLGCTMLLLFLPTLCMGAILPLAIRIDADRLEATGRDVGNVYAANTLGAIGGSVVGGFLLVPVIGSQASLLLLALGNVLLALGVAWAMNVGMPTRVLAGALAVACAAALMGSGGSPVLRRKAIERLEGLLRTTVSTEFYGEDQLATVGLSTEPNGLRRLWVNGIPMTHYGLETPWMAHLPLAMAREPRRVLVLCLGMGNTYLAACRHPVRVRAVELSPKVVEAFHVLQGAAADSVSADDRIEVGDARHALLVSPAGYWDVITVDPPPPLYAAGTVNFHTREFFEQCRDKLSPGGVVCFWIPFHHCTVEEFKIILHTFLSVFPRASVWVGSPQLGLHGSGLYVMGLSPGAESNPRQIEMRLVSPAVSQDMSRRTSVPLSVLLPVAVLDRAGAETFCANAPSMDDDHPWLEFPLFRNADRPEPMSWEQLRAFISTRSGGAH